MLGDLLAAAKAGSGAFPEWLKGADPELAAAVDEAARAEALSPASFVRCAISDFARFASEEDWVTLTSGLRQSADPGTACLLAMVDWRLTIEACPAHSGQHQPD